MARAIAAAIRAERARAGLTQDQLADRLRWSRTKLVRAETGGLPIPVAALPELCLALECTLYDLLTNVTPEDRKALGLDE